MMKWGSLARYRGLVFLVLLVGCGTGGESVQFAAPARVAEPLGSCPPLSIAWARMVGTSVVLPGPNGVSIIDLESLSTHEVALENVEVVALLGDTESTVLAAYGYGVETTDRLLVWRHGESRTSVVASRALEEPRTRGEAIIVAETTVPIVTENAVAAVGLGSDAFFVTQAQSGFVNPESDACQGEPPARWCVGQLGFSSVQVQVVAASSPNEGAPHRVCWRSPRGGGVAVVCGRCTSSGTCMGESSIAVDNVSRIGGVTDERVSIMGPGVRIATYDVRSGDAVSDLNAAQLVGGDWSYLFQTWTTLAGRVGAAYSSHADSGSSVLVSEFSVGDREHEVGTTRSLRVRIGDETRQQLLASHDGYGLVQVSQGESGCQVAVYQ